MLKIYERALESYRSTIFWNAYILFLFDAPDLISVGQLG